MYKKFELVHRYKKVSNYMLKKYDEEIQSFINGNIDDYEKFLKGLSKLQLAEFIYFAQENYGYDIHALMILIYLQ